MDIMMTNTKDTTPTMDSTDLTDITNITGMKEDITTRMDIIKTTIMADIVVMEVDIMADIMADMEEEEDLGEELQFMVEVEVEPVMVMAIKDNFITNSQN